MNISIIVSTYNSPGTLEKVLWGYSLQEGPPFEIVVADDGSTGETGDAIDRIRRETGLDIRHVWQEDVGFEKSRILNKATVAARGDYLVFTDGDCVPRSDFVSTHARLAEPGRFLSGGAVRLDAVATEHLGLDDIASGEAFRRSWPTRHGSRPDRKAFKLSLREPWATLADRLTTTGATFNGGNTSAYRADVVAVNGFDERLRYGGQDRELGERLVNSGIRGKQVRHRAIVLHLHHDRPYKSTEVRAENDRIRKETRKSGRTRAELGLDQWL